MNKDLTVTLFQSQLFWEDAEKNKANFEDQFHRLQNKGDLIVLPEMFTTGFSMKSEKLFETMDGPSVTWMKDWARKLNVVLTGSIIIKEKSQFFNRLIVAFPTGVIEHYDKRHLFRMANEHNHFAAGNEKKIITINGWKICLQICYDLRFPVWTRNTENYDCLLYVANWPQPRNAAWKVLLRARAIENQVYAIGVNRVGEDGLGISYSGDSAIISPKGDYISQTEPNLETTLQGTLSYTELNEFRKKFPVALDADRFEIHQSS